MLKRLTLLSILKRKKKELIKKFNDWDKSLEVEQMTHEEEKLLKESEGEYITLEEAKKAVSCLLREI
ncbi:hypothetical protein [Thermoanaerobacter sp. RKWS2]|uniref:hypothetical protein n=1 Tax=Thermoanaerobacter sp. RKWS2 TaxID=2983842 RepID=UPI00224A65F3|nr:hypothetical protein [Thermoanaerobacter sp. RKWS2]UZQ82890.1 hypothetical protein OEI98_002839 [Thermoanaerobacter sp. RKWS2]